MTSKGGTMTTFSCKNSVYIHIPKTAGNTISRLLGKNKLVNHGYITPRMNGVVDPHANVSQIYDEDLGKPRWTVFRNPISWFESYWSYKRSHGWARGPTQKQALNFIDDRVVKDSIDDTVAKCYQDRASVVECVYAEYWDDKTIIALQGISPSGHDQLYKYINQIIAKVEKIKLDKQYWGVANSTQNKSKMNEKSAKIIWENEYKFFGRYYNEDKTISDEWAGAFDNHLKERS